MSLIAKILCYLAYTRTFLRIIEARFWEISASVRDYGISEQTKPNAFYFPSVLLPLNRTSAVYIILKWMLKMYLKILCNDGQFNMHDHFAVEILISLRDVGCFDQFDSKISEIHGRFLERSLTSNRQTKISEIASVFKSIIVIRKLILFVYFQLLTVFRKFWFVYSEMASSNKLIKFTNPLRSSKLKQ